MSTDFNLFDCFIGCIVIVFMCAFLSCTEKKDRYGNDDSSSTYEKEPLRLPRPTHYMPVPELRAWFKKERYRIENTRGSCIIQHALILIGDGTTKQAQDIKPGDIVVGDGENLYSVDFVTVGTYSGKIHKSFTPYHPVLVNSNGTSTWVSAEDAGFADTVEISGSDTKVYNFGTYQIASDGTKIRGQYIVVDGIKAMTIFSGVLEPRVYSKFWGTVDGALFQHMCASCPDGILNLDTMLIIRGPDNLAQEIIPR